MLHYRYLDIIEPTIGFFIRRGQNRYLFFSFSVSFVSFVSPPTTTIQVIVNVSNAVCSDFRLFLQICFLLLFHDCASLAAAVRASIVALLFVHFFGIGRGLLVRAFFGCTCAKFPRVWILFTTDGRTGILSEMTGKLCFARLNQL